MEKPDLEILMHKNEEFAFDTLAHLQNGCRCMWVLMGKVMNEDIVKAMGVKPPEKGAMIDYVFHYEKTEMEAAASRYQRYYRPHRSRLN